MFSCYTYQRFLYEFQTVLTSAATTPHEFIITDDFNIHLMTLSTLPLNNLQTYCHPVTSSNMFLSLPVCIIIHWTSLSLLLKQISLQQHHNLLLPYLNSFLLSPTSTLHPYLLFPPPPSKISFRRIQTPLISSNSTTTSLHPI